MFLDLNQNQLLQIYKVHPTFKAKIKGRAEISTKDAIQRGAKKCPGGVEAEIETQGRENRSLILETEKEAIEKKTRDLAEGLMITDLGVTIDPTDETKKETNLTGEIDQGVEAVTDQGQETETSEEETMTAEDLEAETEEVLEEVTAASEETVVATVEEAVTEAEIEEEVGLDLREDSELAQRNMKFLHNIATMKKKPREQLRSSCNRVRLDMVSLNLKQVPTLSNTTSNLQTLTKATDKLILHTRRTLLSPPRRETLQGPTLLSPNSE